jgi:aminoglycoside phosphotransferase (APT) family kinase protein
MAWLDAHQPDDVANCVIHNDFRFDNLVLDREDPTRVVGGPRLGDGDAR